MNNFAINIRVLRFRKKLTQAQVSEELNLGEKVLSNYETGKRQPDFDMLLAFADYYGVTTDYLLRENAETKKFSETLARLKEDYLDRDFLQKIEESEMWEKYQEHRKNVEEQMKEHEDDPQWQEYGDIIEDYDKQERYEEAGKKALIGDFYGAEEDFEKLLFEGCPGAFNFLASVCTEIMKIESIEGVSFPLEGYEAELEYIEKILVYGIIAYKEIAGRIESIYNGFSSM